MASSDTPDLLTCTMLDGTEANLWHLTSPITHPSALPFVVQQLLQLRPASSTSMDPNARSWAGPALHWQWRPMATGSRRLMIPSLQARHLALPLTSPSPIQQLWQRFMAG
eukprot:Em0006g1165a